MKIFLFTLVESGIFPKFPLLGRPWGARWGLSSSSLVLGWLLCSAVERTGITNSLAMAVLPEKEMIR